MSYRVEKKENCNKNIANYWSNAYINNSGLQLILTRGDAAFTFSYAAANANNLYL